MILGQTEKLSSKLAVFFYFDLIIPVVLFLTWSGSNLGLLWGLSAPSCLLKRSYSSPGSASSRRTRSTPSIERGGQWGQPLRWPSTYIYLNISRESWHCIKITANLCLSWSERGENRVNTTPMEGRVSVSLTWQYSSTSLTLSVTTGISLPRNINEYHY